MKGQPHKGGQRQGGNQSAKKPSTSSWGGVADWYKESLQKDDTYQQKVILPNVLRLLDVKPGMSVLDIGCGEGFFSRAIAEKGANVLGVDISQELIMAAEDQTVPGSQYSVASSEKIEIAPDDTFDAAIIVLALQNIKDLDGTFKEAARVLKPNGALVMILNHPAFRIPKSSSWVWDEGLKAFGRRVDRYMSEQEIPIDMHPGERGAKSLTVSFHRPMQVYVKALVKHGFAIAGMEEWISHKASQAGMRAQAEDTARKEFPLFLMMKAVKIMGE